MIISRAARTIVLYLAPRLKKCLLPIIPRSHRLLGTVLLNVLVVVYSLCVCVMRDGSVLLTPSARVHDRKYCSSDCSTSASFLTWTCCSPLPLPLRVLANVPAKPTRSPRHSPLLARSHPVARYNRAHPLNRLPLTQYSTVQQWFSNWDTRAICGTLTKNCGTWPLFERDSCDAKMLRSVQSRPRRGRRLAAHGQ
jgi:hypothetical protein